MLSAGLEPELASRIISGRPYASLQDARNRDLLSVSTLEAIEQVAQSSEPGSMQPWA
jgi:hypothetical protein